MKKNIDSVPLQNLRVLVVEDEILIAEELRERLTQNGLRIVDVVDSGERAIQVVERDHPDLVLMDIRLKGKIDGIEAAETIRSNVKGPVIFLTAHSDQETVRRAKMTEPFGFVVKPFQERELVVTIEMSLHRYGLEQRLKESEQRYAATLSSIGDGVISTDYKSRVTFMNPVAESLTQWPENDAKGLDLDDVFPVVLETTGDPCENPAIQAMRLKKIVPLTEPAGLKTRHKEMIPIGGSAAPITSEKVELLGAVVAFRDFRQQRLAEEALQRAEEQLRQAQKMEAIGYLAGGIAHDFNNVITVVNGFVHLLLLKENLDDHAKVLLKEIKKAGERAGALTGQLLAFSCKQVLQPTAFHLGTLVEDLSLMLERLIGEDVVLTAKSTPDLWSIWADPGQIEQTILNLAVNARDAMPQGGQLRIEMCNIEITEREGNGKEPLEVPPGSYVFMTVTDTGIGINPEVQDRIFEPFCTTKEPGEGSGLGLASVYGIVKQSGGFISFLSEIGLGTTFKLYFPALRSETPIMRQPIPKEERFPHGKEMILVVEDDDSVRMLTASALQQYGYTVREASGGEEALGYFAENSHNIQLIVTDVVMRGISGRQVAEGARNVNPAVRILYLSGYTDDMVVRHGLLKGEVAFLQKPFTMEALAKKVREVLDQDNQNT